MFSGTVVSLSQVPCFHTGLQHVHPHHAQSHSRQASCPTYMHGQTTHRGIRHVHTHTHMHVHTTHVHTVSSQATSSRCSPSPPHACIPSLDLTRVLRVLALEGVLVRVLVGVLVRLPRGCPPPRERVRRRNLGRRGGRRGARRPRRCGCARCATRSAVRIGDEPQLTQRAPWRVATCLRCSERTRRVLGAYKLPLGLVCARILRPSAAHLFGQPIVRRAPGRRRRWGRRHHLRSGCCTAVAGKRRVCYTPTAHRATDSRSLYQGR
jgi:hypothetical protein